MFRLSTFLICFSISARRAQPHLRRRRLSPLPLLPPLEQRGRFGLPASTPCFRLLAVMMKRMQIFRIFLDQPLRPRALLLRHSSADEIRCPAFTPGLSMTATASATATCPVAPMATTTHVASHFLMGAAVPSVPSRVAACVLKQAAGSESVLPLKLTVYLATGVAAWSRLNHASATLALLAWPWCWARTCCRCACLPLVRVVKERDLEYLSVSLHANSRFVDHASKQVRAQGMLKRRGVGRS